MKNKKQVLGVRASDDFIVEFNALCAELGHNRSNVIRYCLRRFISDHAKGSAGFERVRAEMY
jgi:metal-responsive CopG/Arc/MetJ family transcriptional regulator